MLLGILSDTHDQSDRTKAAIECLRQAGALALAHCGDLTSPDIVRVCSILPLWFVFGNHDSDSVPRLRESARACCARCLEWSGVFDFDGTRIGLAHGHMRTDLERIRELKPAYLLTGHSHIAHDFVKGTIRRINPGALHEGEVMSVALLDCRSGELRLIRIE